LPGLSCGDATEVDKETTEDDEPIGMNRIASSAAEETIEMYIFDTRGNHSNMYFSFLVRLIRDV